MSGRTIHGRSPSIGGYTRARAPSLGGTSYSFSPNSSVRRISHAHAFSGQFARSHSIGGFKFSRSSSVASSESVTPATTPLKAKPCTDVRRARALERWRRIQQQVYTTMAFSTAGELKKKAFQERRWFTISNPESYPYRFSVCPMEKMSMSADVVTEIAEREGLLTKRERKESICRKCSNEASPAVTSRNTPMQSKR